MKLSTAVNSIFRAFLSTALAMLTLFGPVIALGQVEEIDFFPRAINLILVILIVIISWLLLGVLAIWGAGFIFDKWLPIEEESNDAFWFIGFLLAVFLSFYLFYIFENH